MSGTPERYAPARARDLVGYGVATAVLVLGDMVLFDVAWWFWAGAACAVAGREVTKWRMRRLAREYESEPAGGGG